MTLGVLGAILAGLLIWRFLATRDVPTIVIAVLLGVVIAGSGGPLGSSAHAALDGLKAVGNVLVQMV